MIIYGYHWVFGFRDWLDPFLNVEVFGQQVQQEHLAEALQVAIKKAAQPSNTMNSTLLGNRATHQFSLGTET